MGYKSRTKQARRAGSRPIETANIGTIIPSFQAKVIDDKSRRSWILISVKIPQWQILFEDWFHVYCADKEHLQLDYAFNSSDRGIATDTQLITLMEKLTQIAIGSYLYLSPSINGKAFLVDRFHELDLNSYTS
jgi:hypothetical protein